MMRWQSNQQQSNNNWGNEKEEYEVDPNVYADELIRRIITSLSDTIQAGKDISQGYALYSLNVDMLELICKSNKWLGNEYQKSIDTQWEKAGLKKEDYGKDPKTDLRFSKIKFGILLEEIFSSRMRDEELIM